MRHLTITDLLLGMRQLLNERRDDLHLSGMGRAYAPKLARQLEQLEALPDAARGGRPLVQQLADKDEQHDGYGEAIYYFTEALMRLPSASESTKDAAKRIREAFVPQLSTLRASYADEAAAATRKRQSLAALKDEMQALAVPVPTGGSLYDWASAFLDAGDDLDKLLQSRALVGNDGMSAMAIRVRSLTIGILSRFRASLLDEIEENAELPRDLESRLFGYIDQLHAAREQAARK